MEPELIEQKSHESDVHVESALDPLNKDTFRELCTCSCNCNANIYNAFLIANYRPDLKFKEYDWLQYDMKYGLGFLAYFTAVIQMTGLVIMIFAFIAKDSTPTDIDEWTMLSSHSENWVLWPFFIIGLFTTYKQLAQIWVDIHILSEWNITVKNNIHVFFLKYMAELILYTAGSFAYYVTLSWYARGVEYLDVILKLLCYQFIFLMDECAYLLVKDIVRRRLHPEHCSGFFEGKRQSDIYRWEMMIGISIPLSISFVIQGIFSRSWAIFGLGWLCIGLWSFDLIYQCICHKKRQIYR
eukprot:459411_1